MERGLIWSKKDEKRIATHEFSCFERRLSTDNISCFIKSSHSLDAWFGSIYVMNWLYISSEWTDLKQCQVFFYFRLTTFNVQEILLFISVFHASGWEIVETFTVNCLLDTISYPKQHTCPQEDEYSWNYRLIISFIYS